MKISAWMLAATMACAVLLMGSVESWQLAIVACLAASTLVVASFECEPIRPRREAVLLFWVAVTLTVFTALQCVPLPTAVVARLSPHASQVWDRSMHPFGEPGPAWRALSLDPYATRIEVLKGLTYLMAFSAASLVARDRKGLRFLIRTLIAMSVIVAAVALVHEGFGLQRVWGIYKPKTPVSSISPLMNSNQLSGFCAIGLLCAAGSTFSKSPIMRRSVSAIIVIGLAGAETWFSSRGALGSVVAGLAIVAWFSLSARRDTSVASTKWAIPVFAAVAGIAMVVVASSEAAKKGIEERDISKLLVARTALTHMAPNYVLFGAGRGAFQSTFPEFMRDSGYFVFTHPENVIAEWITGWGLPVALLALATIAYALRPAALTHPSRAASGAYAAVIALALQSLVDFGSETPGVMVSLTVCAAVVVSGERGPSAHRPWRWSPARASLLASITLAVAALIVANRSKELVAMQDGLAQLLRESTPPRAIIAAVRDARSAHPAEPYFPYAGAIAASREPHGNVPLWVGSTLERAPMYGPAHLVLARWLRARSPAQARLEYRLAQEQGLPFPIPFAEVQGLVTDFHSALEVALPAADGVPLLEYLVLVIKQRLPSSTAMIDQEILRREPNNPGASTRVALAAWQDVEARDAAPWCDQGHCGADALAAAHHAQEAAHDQCDGYLVEARVMVESGRGDDGLRALRDALDKVTAWAACDAALARLAIDAHDDAAASTAIEALAKRPCVRDDDCTENLINAASLESSRNSPRRALVYLRRADNLEPSREDVLKSHAAAAALVGLHAEALEVYRRLLVAHPNDVSYRGALNAHSAALSGAP